MALIDYFKKTDKPLEVKENPLATLMFGVPKYNSKLKKFSDYYTYAYYAVPTVARCVDLISQNSANVGLKLTKGKDEIEQSPVLELLARPNYKLGQFQFFKQVFRDYLITGNAVITADIGVTSAKPTELWRANPTNMKIKYNSKGEVGSYTFEKNGREKTIDDVRSVFYFQNPSLEDDGYGESLLRAGSAWIDAAREGAEWNTALLENGARPSGALNNKGEALTKEQKAALREQLETKYTGSKNSGRPMLLEGNLEWQEMGLSPKDMDFQSTLNFADRKIADIFGIPFPLISPDAATFSNMETARESLYEDVIIPFVEEFLCAFNNWLMPLFKEKEGVKLVIDYNSIDAYETKNQRKVDRVATLFEKKLITRNEAREMLGMQLDDVEGGDDILISANEVPLNFDFGGSDKFEDELVKEVNDAKAKP